MKTIEILVGIPCSGKSTYCEKRYYEDKTKFNINTAILSRDKIRISLFNNKYIYNKYNENLITNSFNNQFNTFIKVFDIIILDNTHCKEKYIDEIIKNYSEKCYIKIRYFRIGLLTAHYRNIKRYFSIKKWIPIKIMNQMYKNFNNINKSKYLKFNLNE